MNTLIRSTAALALAILPALAQPAPVPVPPPQSAPEAPAPAPRGPGHLARSLGLTDAQKTSIQAIRERHRADLTARREGLQQARAAFHAALRDPATPEAQLRALYDRTSAAGFEMLMASRALRQEVQAVLTPEQRAKAAEMRGFARARHHMRMRRFHLRTGLPN
jgi:Spy/CpxP family protein refolding chaperone